MATVTSSLTARALGMTAGLVITSSIFLACAHGSALDANAFRVMYPDEPARIGKHVQLKPSASCKYDDGRDAHWATTGARLESGALPPGLAIEDAAIAGIPTRAGTFTARVELSGVTCAGKQLPDQHVDITIVAR